MRPILLSWALGHGFRVSVKVGPKGWPNWDTEGCYGMAMVWLWYGYGMAMVWLWYGYGFQNRCYNWGRKINIITQNLWAPESEKLFDLSKWKWPGHLLEFGGQNGGNLTRLIFWGFSPREKHGNIIYEWYFCGGNQRNWFWSSESGNGTIICLSLSLSLCLSVCLSTDYQDNICWRAGVCVHWIQPTKIIRRKEFKQQKGAFWCWFGASTLQ